MPARSGGQGRSGTQKLLAHTRPSAQPFIGRQEQPASPGMQSPVPELSTCPDDEAEVPPVEAKPVVPPVVVPSSVSPPVSVSRSPNEVVPANVSPEVKLSPELSGGPIGSTEPQPASRTNTAVQRILGMVAVCSQAMAERIEFYRSGDDYGEFSNFSRHPIEIDGQAWPTSEHYFQAMKFDDPVLQERIRTAPGPGEAARMGRRFAGLRPDWEDVKEAVMMDALRAKFTQHAKLGRRLLATGTAELVEHTRNDVYWGDGGDGSGRNRLGVLLMQLRDELKDA